MCHFGEHLSESLVSCRVDTAGKCFETKFPSSFSFQIELDLESTTRLSGFSLQVSFGSFIQVHLDNKSRCRTSQNHRRVGHDGKALKCPTLVLCQSWLSQAWG
jgi:hypothetical protein